MKTIRAHLILLGLTLLLCSVVYPLAVLLVGWVAFPRQALGSLVQDEKGTVVGSSLVAQNFSGDQWFWPRPSQCDYNAAAAAASNWGPSNPRLRYRAVALLGERARYRADTQKTTVQEDVEAWYRKRPDALGEWLKAYPLVASAWLDDNKKAVQAWQKDHPGGFFETFAKAHPGAFFDVQDDKVQAVKDGPAVQKAFFELWLRDNPGRVKDIEQLPSDAVTASGSGLDPHITLRHAKQQLPRLAGEWARQSKGKLSKEAALEKAEKVLTDNTITPPGGEPVVNVLEVNLELKKALAGRK